MTKLDLCNFVHKVVSISAMTKGVDVGFGGLWGADILDWEIATSLEFLMTIRNFRRRLCIEKDLQLALLSAYPLELT